MLNQTSAFVLVVGRGRIGQAMESLLKQEGYVVGSYDLLRQVPAGTKYTDVFAAVPYSAIVPIADYAAAMGANFYDFTENIQVKEKIRETYLKHFSGKKMPAVVVGCGVAPGLCNIIAVKLMRQFYKVDSISICCGGVPINKNINPLHYYNLWSLDGLWGLYFGEKVRYKKNSATITGQLGDGHRRIQVMGKEYEAFYTGGNTVDTLFNFPHLPNVSYSTIRHMGHLDKILLLDSFLNFRKNSKLFKDIVEIQENDHNDETVISIEVEGQNKDYSKMVLKDERIVESSEYLSSMQYATAQGGLIALQNVHKRNLTGFIAQEDLELT